MSFKHDEHPVLPVILEDMAGMYADDVRFVLRGAAENPEGTCRVILGDSRKPADIVDGLFDRVITSPPYANRMSYIRELRPYRYWLGFLVDGRDAGKLDWAAGGGIWGIATSRLLEWKRKGDALDNDVLNGALRRIAHHTNKSGHILANYVAKYFDDMWRHLSGLTSILAPGAEVHYVVGNSTFYGVLLPVEQIYGAMLRQLGFEAIECRAIRKRNSKRELVEFDVTARWPRNK